MYKRRRENELSPREAGEGQVGESSGDEKTCMNWQWEGRRYDCYTLYTTTSELPFTHIFGNCHARATRRYSVSNILLNTTTLLAINLPKHITWTCSMTG